jgi:inner membrane protein
VATPVGHALAGYAVYQLNVGAKPEKKSTFFWLCVLMAIAPDLDFIPGILRGQPNLYHQGISHSVGVGLIVSCGVAAVYSLRKGTFWCDWGLLFLAYASHLAVDFFGPDGRPPYGQPLLWPLSGEYYLAPVPVFLGVRHAESVFASHSEWMIGLFHVRNLLAIAIEVVVIAPLIIGVRYMQNFRRVAQNKRQRKRMPTKRCKDCHDDLLPSRNDVYTR